MEVHRHREQDDQHPKALLKSMRDAGDTFDARGNELAAVSNRQHWNGSANGVCDQEERFPFDMR